MRSYDLRALLLELAKAGCTRGPTRISKADIASNLEISAWTLNRWLRMAIEGEYIVGVEIERTLHYQLTERGRLELIRMLADLEIALGRGRVMELRGTVTRGLEEGRHYMLIPEYREGFKRLLGFTPFPGTLNVKLDRDSIGRRKALEKSEGAVIGSFSRGGVTYGSVKCFKAIIENEVGTAEGAVLLIEKTRHGPEILEVISPVNLRERLILDDGDEVYVKVFIKA